MSISPVFLFRIKYAVLRGGRVIRVFDSLYLANQYINKVQKVIDKNK